MDEGGDLVVFGLRNVERLQRRVGVFESNSLRKNFASTIAIFRAKMERVSKVLQFPVIIE
jgi:hypothetical protein